MDAPLFEIDPNIAHIDDVVEVEPLRAVSPVLRDVLFIPSDTESDNNDKDENNDGENDQASPAQQLNLICKNDDAFCIQRPPLVKNMKPPFAGSFDNFHSKDRSCI